MSTNCRRHTSCGPRSGSGRTWLPWCPVGARGRCKQAQPLRDRRAHTAASTRRQARKHLLTPSGCDVFHGVQLAPAAAHIFSFCFSPPLHNRRAPTVELEARAVKPENATWQPHAPSRNASACSCCKARALATGHTSGCTWKMPSQRRPAAAPAAAASTHSRCTPGGAPWAHPECCMPKAILLAAPAAAASTREQQSANGHTPSAACPIAPCWCAYSRLQRLQARTATARREAPWAHPECCGPTASCWRA